MFGRFRFTFNLVEGEGARVLVQSIDALHWSSWLQRTKPLAHLAVLDATLHGEQRLRQMIA